VDSRSEWSPDVVAALQVVDGHLDTPDTGRNGSPRSPGPSTLGSVGSWGWRHEAAEDIQRWRDRPRSGLGWGCGRMSAARVDRERVSVAVLRRPSCGGARSIPVRRSQPCADVEASGHLPGEHGFRFFPRFYRHVTDTMSRIPSATPCHRQLVDTTGSSSPPRPDLIERLSFLR
jgi:hypothetical protein